MSPRAFSTVLAVLVFGAGCTRPVQLMTAPPGRVRAERVSTTGPELASSRQENPIGTWKGVGVQSDGGRWPMRLELTALSGRCATITYPSVPCHGVWRCEERESADGWHEAKETIESGACIDGGTFRYRLIERGASIEWTWRVEGGAVRSGEDRLTARGTLTRASAAADDDDHTAEETWSSDDP